jgi:hypothetical protein
MDREDCLKIGIDFRNGKYPKDTWESLNKKLGKPFCSGEAFRSFVKQKLKKDDKLPKAVEIKNSEIENKLSQLEIKTLELKKERIKNSDLTARLNKLIREEAREEHIIEELKHHIDTVISPKLRR